MTTRRELVRALSAAVGKSNVVYLPEDLSVYAFDGTIEKQTPYAVALPGTTEEVAAVVRVCNRYHVPVTPRGAGTGLSGGAVPQRKGVVISTQRMRQIVEIDPVDRVAVVEPGLPNIQLSEAAAKYGLFYAPDPSSQKACTIGGNVAENAGGPHCLALGVTQNHVLGIEVVTADGEVTWLGGRVADALGYDPRGLFIGSEGTLGIATKDCREAAADAVGRGHAARHFRHDTAGEPRGIGDHLRGDDPGGHRDDGPGDAKGGRGGPALWLPGRRRRGALVEFDGPGRTREPAGRPMAQAICLESGAREIRTAETAGEREQLWKGRKGRLGRSGSSRRTITFSMAWCRARSWWR